MLLVIVFVIAFRGLWDDWSETSTRSSGVHHWREGLRRSLFDLDELHDAHEARKLCGSYGAPPNASGWMWSTCVPSPVHPGIPMVHLWPSRSRTVARTLRHVELYALLVIG